MREKKRETSVWKYTEEQEKEKGLFSQSSWEFA